MDLFDIAVAKKLAGGGGSAQIIEVVGTVANPWGDLDFLTLCDDIASGAAVAEITFLMQDAIPVTVLLSALTYNLRASYVNYNPFDGSFMATSGVWTSAGLSRFDVWQGTGASNTYVNYKDLGAGLATELRIVHI